MRKYRSHVVPVPPSFTSHFARLLNVFVKQAKHFDVRLEVTQKTHTVETENGQEHTPVLHFRRWECKSLFLPRALGE